MIDDITQAPAAFVTFYSFKGGVGRSMALINVAGILAGRGFRVLALDMDLEAPGISYLMQDETHKTAESRPGFVDLLADACSRGPEADLFALDPTDVVERYTYAYTVPEAIRQSDEGLLHIMPAGRLNGDYQARLDALTLGQLYRDGHGQPLIAAFKQVLREARRFDFVFIDSRTGFSDEAGICTRDLADCLMIVMGLNRQNVEGTAAFLRSLRQANVLKDVRVALSPVPNGEDELVEQREKQATQALSDAYGQPVSLSLQIPYHPRLALTEEPHIFRRSRGYLYDAYARIEDAVLVMVNHSPSAFQRVIEAAVKDKQLDVVVRHVKGLRKLHRGSIVLERLVFVGQLADLCLQEDAGELRRCLSASLPADSWTVVHLAITLSKKKIRDAELFYLRALEADPKNSTTCGNYANFLTDVRGDHDGAEELYKRALEVEPKNAATLGNYASFLTSTRGDHDGGEALYKQALEIDPKEATTLGNYANFLTGVRGDHDSAEALYKRALEVDSEEATILGNYANFLAGVRKDNDGAEALHKQALEVDAKDASVLGRYASFLIDVRKDNDGAEALYKQALEANPKDANCLVAYANFLTDVRGNHKSAGVLYEKALETDQSNVACLGNYANFLEKVRVDHEAAETLYKRALEADPKETAILGNYATFLTDVRGDHDGAEALYKRALEVAPKNAANLGNYASFLTSVRGDHDGAEALYKRALEAAPEEATILGNYANFLAGIRKSNDGAEALYKQGLKANPKNANCLGDYANFLTDIRENHDGAEVLYKEALEADPEQAAVLGNYASFLTEARGDHNSAEVLYKRALEVDPEQATILGNYANFLTGVRGDHNSAEMLYKRALEVEPEDADVLSRYASFLVDVRKDYSRADEFYRKAIGIDPKDANCLGNYAKLLFVLDRLEDATAILSNAWEQELDQEALLCELHFYACAHAWQRWPGSLASLKALLQAGANSKGWPLQENVSVATRRGHPAPEFLAALALVVSGEALVETLDKFPAWQIARF